MWIEVEVDEDDILRDLSDEDLVDILNSRNYNWDRDNKPGIFIPVQSLGDVMNYCEALDAAGIQYEVIK